MIAALLAVAVAMQPAVEVTSNRGVYTVRVDATVGAPPEVVWSLLTDYDNLARISPSITRSGVVARLDTSTVIVESLAYACYGPFCRNIRHRQRITEFPPTRIFSETDDAHSDFRDGHAEWRLSEVPDGTRIEYRLTISPTLFVPPFVGPAMVRRAMARATLATIEGIERAAADAP